ncbi:phage tail sheath C-terminal domain-containing protein [Pleionea sp. CnH1-48]|uniref:phage tail sheath family protein n=1 Tax=Pleionea sp. CnH1-48 TaxID=2954494 RepID=UPI0020981D29|nr:phage tail sheath C-terminal domain-containing protein [Pleionea sp. CnH1-48]MCO7226563.1 phage tail sheath subtilisin-like domain-containing protein [Pleionea sp. CnH1-48]
MAMKTPGVYIVEKNAFPNSVVEVATAVPAFIGYTEKADNNNKSLKNKPWRISSMAEFHQYYGFGAPQKFSLEAVAAPDGGTLDDVEADITVKGKDNDTEKEKKYNLKRPDNNYMLYRSMLLFFQNGGGPCYIVSVGSYKDDIEESSLAGGIETLVKEQEPTMVVIPEAVAIKGDGEAEGESKGAQCFKLQQAAVAHCGETMKNRFAILDVYNGDRAQQDSRGNCIKEFRNQMATNFPAFCATYYPWLQTSILAAADLSFENIDKPDDLKALIQYELNLTGDSLPEDAQAQADLVNQITDDFSGTDAETLAKKKAVDNGLTNMSLAYKLIKEHLTDQLNLLPPAAAMAGIYTMVDNAKGVWKAPANVSLSAVVQPSVDISHDEQENLNVDVNGKSINAIRKFIGEGTLVWGARTLDGNSLDWRYINVRRTMIMLEESIRLATKAYVFEANDANTWVTIKSMIQNFLTGIWKRGGLAGSSPDDAFSVHVGLGDTMTPEDILEGILRVTVLVAITRPAEFIEITFQQQMQKS